TPGVEAEAREHGTLRWGQGFLIDEVLWELSALRLVVLDYITRYVAAQGGLTPVEAVEAAQRAVDVIDRTSRASASQFVMDTLTQRREMEARLEAANKELQTAGEQKDRFLAM